MKTDKAFLVTVLTPVATAIAAALTGWIAKHAPGVNVPTGDLVPLMVLGGVSVLAVALHWLQKQSKVVKLEEAVESVAAKVADKVKSDPTANAAAQDLIAKLEAQKDQILQAIASAVHLPPSAEEVAQEMLDQVAAKRSVEVPVGQVATGQSNVVPITGQAPVGPGPVSA